MIYRCELFATLEGQLAKPNAQYKADTIKKGHR